MVLREELPNLSSAAVNAWHWLKDNPVGSWTDSKLRPVLLTLAVIAALVILYLAISTRWPAPFGPGLSCEVSSHQETTVGGGDPGIYDNSSDSDCSPAAIPIGAMWVVFALFSLLMLPEIGTLLPGLRVETPLGKALLSSPDFYEALDEADQESTAEVADYEDMAKAVGPNPVQRARRRKSKAAQM